MDGNRGIGWVVAGVVALVALILLAVFLIEDDDDPEPSLNELESYIDADRELFVLGELNDSNQAGVVLFEEYNDQVKVSILVTDPTEGTQPAHIHLGSCPNSGDILYPLEEVENGKSETVLDATFEQLRAQGELSVNTHKSAQELSIYYGCADIDL